MTVGKITGFHMAVRNMPQAKTFYVDKLGFKVAKDYRQDDEHWWVTLELPDGTPTLNLTTFAENLQPGTLKMYLAAPDIEKAYHDLKSKGVQPTSEIADDGWGKWFELHDPDGNRWIVVQA